MKNTDRAKKCVEPSDEIHLLDGVYRKVSLRILPLLLLAYVVAYLDRINVSFAKLQMLRDLDFSQRVYGLGAGMFFIGYFFCLKCPAI